MVNRGARGAKVVKHRRGAWIEFSTIKVVNIVFRCKMEEGGSSERAKGSFGETGQLLANNGQKNCHPHFKMQCEQ